MSYIRSLTTGTNMTADLLGLSNASVIDTKI